jgi:hypothetical protein
MVPCSTVPPRSSVLAAVARDSARWSAGTAAVTVLSSAALALRTQRWFHALNLGACVVWFIVSLQRLFIPLPPPTPQWSAQEVAMPLLQLMLRIAAGVFTTTPYGPQSNDERLVWCIALWGVSAAVHALLRLWCVLSYACLDGYGVSETRA